MKFTESNRLLSLGFAGLLAAISQSATATPNGIYLNAQVGQGDIDYSASSEGLSPASKDTKKFAWRVAAGNQFNPNMALEFGYIDWGEVNFKNVQGISGAKADIHQKSADLTGKLMYPLSAAADVYVKVGVGYVKAELSPNGTAKQFGVSSSHTNKFRPILGIGGDYEVYPNTFIDASWMHVPSGGNIATSNFFGIGLTYHMG